MIKAKKQDKGNLQILMKMQMDIKRENQIKYFTLQIFITSFNNKHKILI